jgi:predicted phosphodiesterase
VTTSGIGKWYDFDVTTLAQDWVDGTLTNNGLLVRGTSAFSTSTFTFASAQSRNVASRPKLVISYRVGPTPTPIPVPTVIIGHITDAHIGAQAYYSQVLPTVVAAVSQQAQVMVDTGDCTENGSVEESMEYASLVAGHTSIPWRAVPGNHDTPWVFTQYVGPMEWSWDVGDYRLIGINTEAIDYTALDQALTLEKPCIIFGHFPLSYCNPTDQVMLRQRFETYRVPIYVAGHTHVDLLETDPGSGTLLLTGQRAGMGHYRLITLRGYTVESITFN